MGPAYFKAHALDQPVLVLDSSGSSSSANGLPAVSAHDVSRLLDMPTGSAIASVDVEAQTAATLTARSWAEKLRASYDEAGHGGPTSDASSSPLNAIFRVRGTPFAQRVAAPEAVAAVDWRYSLSSHYQQMQEADVVGCYLGLNAFLDFQIAPGGRSSWISVSSGELWVFMVPPTAAHLRTFQQWKLTPPSASSAANALPPSRIFLPELVEKCIKCVVSSGASIIVPAGYAIALFAAQSDDCSFFSGLFSATSAIDKQLQVVLDLEMQSTRQQQQQPSTAIATSIWSIALDAPDTDIRVVDSQISTAVKQYSQQLSVPNMAISISDQDKLALRRALPFLRRWSTSSTASSPSEAQEAVSQLEQALTMASPSPMHSQFGHSYGNMLMDRGLQPGFGNTMHASVDGVATPTKSANTSLPSLSPTEANYIYAAAGAADDWLASEATGMGGSLNMGMGTGGGMESFADPVGYHNPIQSVWGEYNAHQQFTAPPAPGLDQNRLISSQGSDGSNFFPSMGGFNSAASTPLVPTSDGLFVSLGSSYSSGPSSVNNPSSYFGDQFSAGSVSSQISATAMALGIGTRPTSSTDVDALVRHRASCHRCGNLRKKNVRCPTCPHIFCQKCAEKMVEEHGEEIFSGGCPVCKERCCCGKNRSATCTRKVSFSYRILLVLGVVTHWGFFLH